MCVFCILDSQMQSTFNHTPKKKNYYLHSSLCNLMLSKCGILIILIIIIWHRTMYDCFYLFFLFFVSRLSKSIITIENPITVALPHLFVFLLCHAIDCLCGKMENIVLFFRRHNKSTVFAMW